VREEAVDPPQPIAEGAVVPVSGPVEGVVLAGHQGHAGRDRVRGRPPGAEHVPVDQVGTGEPWRKPLGKRTTSLYPAAQLRKGRSIRSLRDQRWPMLRTRG
jgi:hypothetical protein